MKTNRKSLLEAVRVAGRICGKKSSLPILGCVVLDGEKQELQATDLETGLVWPLEITDYTHEAKPEEIPEEFRIGNNLADLTGPQLKNLAEDYGIELPAKAKVAEIRETILAACEKSEQEMGTLAVVKEKFCLPCQGLKRILDTLDEEIVEIMPVQDGDQTLFGRTPDVCIGENFSNLRTMDPSEFPVFPENLFGNAAVVKVPRKDLDAVAVAGTNEDKGFRLDAVHFDLREKAIVATDGHRMHLATLDDVDAPQDLECFEMPIDAIRVVRSVFGEKDRVPVEYDRESRMIRVMFGENGGRLYSRALEIRFPQWTAVVPKVEAQKWVSLEKSALEKPLMQALAISDGKYGGVQVKFNGGIDLVFNNPDRGTYQKVSIPLKGKNYTDEENVIGLNMRYIVEAMRPVESEDLEIRFEDASKPVTMEYENFKALVMPMRV
jgi:DNA polymerase III subunit beta